MKPFVDFYAAWRFLEGHKIFELEECSVFFRCLSIEVVKVNPDTEKIDDNEAKNTATRVWLECGPWCHSDELTDEERKGFPYGVSSHDVELDCGAPTFEQAIIKLANQVLKKYASQAV